MTRFADTEHMANLKATLPEFEKFLEDNLNSDGWLSGGPNPGALDIHCFVFMERLVCLESTPWKYGFDTLGLKTSAPRMMKYVHNFREHEVMRENTMDLAQWSKQQEL